MAGKPGEAVIQVAIEENVTEPAIPVLPEVHKYRHKMAESGETDGKVVVIAIDATKHSDHAFEYFMINIYKPTDNIILVHCPECTKAVHGLTSLKDSSEATSEDKRVKNVLEKFAEKLRVYGVGGRVRKIPCKPGKGVVQVALEEKASLIVTGSRDLTGIRRTFTECVSDYVLRHASCPVLVCSIKNTKRLISPNADE